MKLIEPKVELMQQAPGLVGMYKHIERCARTCYKTEDSITENSYEKLCDKLMKAKHFAMFEHGTVYLNILYTIDNVNTAATILNKYYNNPYSKVNFDSCLVTTNFRVIIENHWEDDLQYICEPTEFHERRITLKFTTNIGVTREGNRHRVNSIAEESTRYCNYGNEKFGGAVTFTKPTWITDDDIEKVTKEPIVIRNGLPMLDFDTLSKYNDNHLKAVAVYLESLAIFEDKYKELVTLGWSPQQAREVLPLATKSEVVYTAFASDWKHWFDLRLVGTTGKPHPNMEQVAWLAQQELIKNNLWDLIYDPNNKSDKV